MRELAQHLDQAIKAAGVPILGVSIGDPDNRATWKVHPAALQAQAQPVIDAFVIPTPNTLLDQYADVRINDPALKAWGKAVWEAIPSPLKTFDETRARAKQIFKS